jgi:pimeloyl-ACP methyl ester carboxylesterase
LIAVAAAVLGASACIPSAPKRAPTSAPGSIGWQDCFDQARAANQYLSHSKRVECGTVKVPKDWNNPDNGQTLDISLMRIYTGRVEDKKGSVLLNPGGPGGSGIGFLPYWVQPQTGPAPDALLDNFVAVTFDPRGVGESAPIKCVSDADLDASFGFDPDPSSQADFDALVALNRRIDNGCGSELGDDARLFSTVQTAHDMDAIREALGEDKLTYLGYSYGTELGAVYAQLFPSRVRAFVLDGAVDVQANAIQHSEEQAMGFERALTNFDAWCRSNASQCAISADPKGTIVDQLTKARTRPVKGADGRSATAGWVMVGVTSALYAQEVWGFLGQAIKDLSSGDASRIFALADSYAERDDRGHYSNLFDAFNAITCADEDNDPTLDQIRGLQTQWRTKYPVFGTSLAVGLVSCTLWPGKRDPVPTGPATGAPPIVVVGTTGDPATPYESTQKLADMLGVGVVLTWEGEGHTAYPSTQCITDAVDHYLIDLVVPEKGLRCPA